MFQLKVRSYVICHSPPGLWIKKLWYIYTMEFYAAERKKELIPFATGDFPLHFSQTAPEQLNLTGKHPTNTLTVLILSL